LRAVPDKKIIENAERPRRKNNPQPLDDSLKRLAECGRPGYRSQNHEYHGGKRKEHVERNCLRERNAIWKDTKYSAVELAEKRWR